MKLAKKVTVPSFVRKPSRRTMVTAYDASFAKMFDQAGVDAILVGDSLGMVIQGMDDTLSVTLEDVIYHTRCVARGSSRALIVSDLPFLTYHGGMDEAVLNAGRLIKEGGAHAVKLEGGVHVADKVRAMVSAGIPVMGHVGLTPQHVHAMGGFKVQGKGHDAERIDKDVDALVEAGVFSIVLEGIPRELAKSISERIDVPTIGIGAGPDCGGQVLVGHDLLGMIGDFQPKFVRQFASFYALGVEAARAYVDAVTSGSFPEDAHSFHDKSAEPPLKLVGGPDDECRYGAG